MTPEPTRDAPSSISPSVAAQGKAAADPAIAPLFHMSRTAGVGLGDYAAVNVPAVIGLVLAVASVLAYIFADSTLPMLIPVAAVLVSTIAFVQISRSNGTQTGRGIAIAGVVIALALGGAAIARKARTAAAEREARVELTDLIRQLSDANASRDAKPAWSLFHSSFHEQIAFDAFSRKFIDYADSFFQGKPIGSYDLSPLAIFQTNNTGVPVAATALLGVNVAGQPPAGIPSRIERPVQFTREGDVWKIRDVPDFFIPPKPRE